MVGPNRLAACGNITYCLVYQVNVYYVTKQKLEKMDMENQRTAEWLANQISKRTERGIGEATAMLIRTGALPVGTQLPTMRELAFHLGVSPATVSQAWKTLRRQKTVTGRGRNGLWVTGDLATPHPSRLSGIGKYRTGVLDLTYVAPDPTLLPPMDKALVHATCADQLNVYNRISILPELKTAVASRWPYQPEAFMATNGGFNAIFSTLHALIYPGSMIAVEMPTSLRILDIIEDLGAEICPVGCDEYGPVPDSLAESLEKRPVAFFFQPRTHSVTGVAVTNQRMKELAKTLSRHDTLIIEDDGLSDISAGPPISLGIYFPERVVHIHSFSKSLAPDLRLAVVSCTHKIAWEIQSFRNFSAGWTSRILQSAGAWLLNDKETKRYVRLAQKTYSMRRRKLVKQLSRNSITLPYHGGLSLWIPVFSEQYAIVTLAAFGIAVLPGAKFSTLPTSHIRVSTTLLSKGYKNVATAISIAAAAPGLSDGANLA